MMSVMSIEDGVGKKDVDTASIGSRGSLSMDDDWCVLTEAAVNKELVLDMDNSAEVAQLAASYISRQLMQIAEEDMTSDIVDKIFRVLTEVGEMDDQILHSFILEFINEQDLWDKQHKKGDDDSKTSHRAVIKMLLELLRFSPVPVENNVIWVKLLAKLGQYPQDVAIMIDLKVAATIMGTMAVHSNIVQIQEHGCRVLGAMAKFKPTPVIKAPLRESSIQVLVMALEKHHYQPAVIRAACSVLSNLTATMSDMSSWAMNQGFSDEEAEKLIVLSLDILEYVKEYAMPRLERCMEAYKEDETIQTEGLKIQACFGCHSPSLHRFKRTGYSSLKRRQHSILKSTETTRSPRGSTPPRRVTFSHELDTQLEMSDTDSEFEVEEPPKRHTVCGATLYDSDDGMEDGYEEVADLKLCNGALDEKVKEGLKLINVELVPDGDLPNNELAVPNGEATLLDEDNEYLHQDNIFLEDNPDREDNPHREDNPDREENPDQEDIPEREDIPDQEDILGLEDNPERTLSDEEPFDLISSMEDTSATYVIVPDCIIDLLNDMVDQVCTEIEVANLVEEAHIGAVTVVGDHSESICAALNELACKAEEEVDIEENISESKDVDGSKEDVSSGFDDNVPIKEQRLTKILDSCLEDKFFTAICSDLEQLQMELETASAMVDEEEDTSSSRNTSPFSTLIKQGSLDMGTSCESLPDVVTDSRPSNNRSKHVYDDVTIEGLDNGGCFDLQRVVDKEYFSHNSSTSPFEQGPFEQGPFEQIDDDANDYVKLQDDDDAKDYIELKDLCDGSPDSSESGYGHEVEVCESPCKLMAVEVEESAVRFTEYNEIDIVEALIKAGLINDTDSNMEVTSSENDQERGEDDSSAGENFSPMVPRASQRKKLSLTGNSFNMSISDEYLNAPVDEILTKELPFPEFDFVNNAYLEEQNENDEIRNNSDDDNGNVQERGRSTHREGTKRQGSGNFSGSCNEIVKRRDRSKSGNRRLSAQHRREAFAGNYNHHYEQLAVELEKHQSTADCDDAEIEDINDIVESAPSPAPVRRRPHVYEQVHPEGVVLRAPPNRDRESLTSSPTSSISSTSISFTEWSDLDAVYERDEEGSIVSADGILENAVMKRHLSSDEFKKGLRQRALSQEETGPSPPKPRRTWYYTSSADVRKSLVRNSQPDLDVSSLFSATYARVSKNPRLKGKSLPDIRLKKTNTNASSDSGVATGDEDLLLGHLRSPNHLYEEVCMTSDGEDTDTKEEPKPVLRKQQGRCKVTPDIRSTIKSEVRKTQLLDQDSSEATYNVCTHWVNQDCSKALTIFDELTKRLVSPYSILPATKQLEDQRKMSLGSVLDDIEFDFPAWTSILNVLAADEPKWTMTLAAQVLPILDRLFYTKDEAIMDAAIELVQLVITKFGKEIEKNHNGGLFRTRYREDCRTCFLWLSKLFTRVSDLLKKEAMKDEDLDSLLHVSLLNSLQGALQPYCHRSSRLTMLKD